MTDLLFADKVVAIHDALDGASIRHAIGGALALAYYAEPRLTVDIDVNVFVDESQWRLVADALQPIGVDCSTNERELERDGWVRWMWGQNPVDVFFAYDAFHEAIRANVRTVPYGERRLPILAPEHLLTCKAVFDRRKDWLDIEGMLAATDGINVGEVRRWLDHLVGPDDQRRRHFDEVAAAILGE